jgi:hypothetical protein
MLSPQVQERISPPVNLFYCDCSPDCVDSFILPALVVEMLYSDNTLMLLVGKHESDKAGEVVKKGKGWRICRVKFPKG